MEQKSRDMKVKATALGSRLKNVFAPRVSFMKPAYWIPFWVFSLYVAWLASPYLAYYAIGVPDLSQVRQIVGDVRWERVGTYTRFGYRAAPTHIYAKGGTQQAIHCGFVMHKRDCHVFGGLQPFEETVVWHHWYFGVLHAARANGDSLLKPFDTPQAIQDFNLRTPLREKVRPWLLTLVFLSGFWITCALKTNRDAKR
jgi:hypothetical protein